MANLSDEEKASYFEMRSGGFFLIWKLCRFKHWYSHALHCQSSNIRISFVCDRTSVNCSVTVNANKILPTPIRAIMIDVTRNDRNMLKLIKFPDIFVNIRICKGVSIFRVQHREIYLCT